jgi:hypothetical protein
MVRKRIYDEAMTPLQRRQKNDSDRRARGEKRVTGWLDVDSHAALRFMLELRGESIEYGDVQRVINGALVYLARANGMTDERAAGITQNIMDEQNASV